MAKIAMKMAVQKYPKAMKAMKAMKATKAMKKKIDRRKSKNGAACIDAYVAGSRDIKRCPEEASLSRVRCPDEASQARFDWSR